MKMYGKIEYNEIDNKWLISQILPQASIKLKNLIPKINKTATAPFYIKNSKEIAVDLEWFFVRYPFEMDEKTKKNLDFMCKEYKNLVEKSEEIIHPEYKPKKILGLKKGCKFEKHQLSAADFSKINHRFLLVDPVGSGKTYASLAIVMSELSFPSAFVVQSHLTQQFKKNIENFSNLKVHIIQTKKMYSLPKADIYIFKYGILNGWTHLANEGFFNSVVFDEIQELRHGTDTAKGEAAKYFTKNTHKCIGVTATPIYGYGIEFFNIYDILNEGVLGTKEEFIREWCSGNDKKIKDTLAFGEFLRESRLMLKRDKKETKIDNIAYKIIPETIEYDQREVESVNELASKLALKVLTGTFTEQGQAAREFDIRLRLATGVSKAKYVANFVRMIVESGEKVLLSGWHREFYEKILMELKDLKPVMYTGTESEKQKAESVEKFKNDHHVFILSHVSGSGLDGLQHVCSTAVIGELAWSSEIHKQIIGRLLRRGQLKEVFAFILMSDFGSDPIIRDIIDIKFEQQNGVLNPEDYNKPKVINKEENLSRLKMMAKKFLENKSEKK